MRNFGEITSLALASLFAVITSCVLDPAEHQPTKEAQSDELSRSTVDDPPASPRVGPAEQASNAGATENAITPAVNCSTVEFCNGSGSDGTICQQNACGLAAAQNECRADVRSVCGSPTCPFIFITTSGQHITLPCNTTNCSGGAIACGGHCCGTSAKFCGGTGACCDGVTCTPGCPC